MSIDFVWYSVTADHDVSEAIQGQGVSWDISMFNLLKSRMKMKVSKEINFKTKQTLELLKLSNLQILP